MTTAYLLKFFEQTFSFDNEVNIYRSRNNDDVVPQYYVFLDGKLYNFKYDNFNKWNTTLLLRETFKNKVLYFPKTLKNQESVILLKTNTGIDFYQYIDNKFNLLLQSQDFDENLFNDVFDWHKPGNIIKCGNFYYDKNLIGILTKHKEHGLQFHAIMKDDLLSGEYPIWPLNTNLNLFGNTSNSNFFLADLKSKGRENIIVRTRSGLDIYEFDQRNNLQHLLQVSDSSKTSDFEENLFFPFLTGQSLRDIVVFNNSGLFIYQYNLKLNNYNFIHYNPLFDKHSGWDNKYVDTVRFKDINFDGREEMLFTGPGGIDILTFDNYTLQWESILNNSNIAIANRHSYITEVEYAKSINADHAILFTQRENKLHWANIEPIFQESDDDFGQELSNEISSNDTSTLSAIPSSIKWQDADKEKPLVLLREQLDYSSIFKAVDQDTGKANFKLPLIDLPNFSKGEQINFYYNGNNKASSILGVGWTFPVGVITMDDQGSIFPENERYFLLLEDFPQPLLLDSERSTDGVKFFKLSDQGSKTQIVYYKSEERWEIDYRGVKQIYGRGQNSSDDSISLDLSWQYWRGAGSSSIGQSELVTAWFLTEIRSEHNSSIFYTYDVHNVLIPSSNKKCTREAYLKTISDNEGNKIAFNYSRKGLNEYNLPPLVDEKGNYNAKKVQTRYLAGYSVTTDSYRQDINFIYKVENGKRFLEKIVQEGDPNNQPILQFSYKKLLSTSELEQVILPTGASIEFYYETIGGTSDVIDKISLTCNVLNSYRVDYGQDFVLISYINKHFHVSLRMFDRALRYEMYSSSSHTETSRFPFLGLSAVSNYEVKIAEDTLAFVLHYADNQEVCLLRRKNEKWLLDPKYFNYDKNAIIQIGIDFIVILDTNKSLVEVIVWNEKSAEWTKENIQNISIANSKDVLLQVSGKVFLIYNDNVVIVGFRNKDNKWHSKVIITLPEVISTIKRTLNKFDLDSNVHDQLLNLLKNNAFQISNNFILFNRWNVEGLKIYSQIELYSLNSKYEIVHQENHKILQDDLTKFSREIEQENDKKKSYFTLAYEKDGDRFKLIVKDFRGSILGDIETYCKVSDDVHACVTEYKKGIKEKVNDAYKHNFILNLTKYLAHLQSPVALCGTTKFTFNGNNWIADVFEKESESRWSISMNDKFILSKDNSQSSIKLYNPGKNDNYKGNLLLDLAVKHNGQILNKYPTYLVVQKENREVNIVFYEFLNYDNVKNTFILPQGETLSVMSDQYTLVTHADNISGTEELSLNFRQFFGLRSSLPNEVVKRLTVNFDNDSKRVTGYNYDVSSVKAVGDILYYEKTYLIPGNEQSSNGIIEELKNITGNLNTVRKIYDAGGNLIKILQDENIDSNKKNIKKESDSSSSLLLDYTGNLEVAQFYPYEMDDEEVGYYGFEDYEVNKIGLKNSTNFNRWFFNKADIIKREFSLTGENYLRLSETRLLGTFQPKNQNQNYVASCWIRSPGKFLEVGTIAPFLKAVVYTADKREINGYLSEVKFQYDDWYYLEVVIDFFFAREVLSNLVSKSTSSLKPFKTIVSISPALNTTLHVDHIRFSPLNSNFQATTYHFKIKEIKEIINANGLIKRYLYNDYKEKIVSINENGEIELFSTSTKATSIGKIVSLKSKIEIQPNGGFYEDFNPHAFIKRWKIDNDANWKIAPSVLYHRSNNFDKLKLRNMHTEFDSFGIRLHFSLQSEMSTIKFNDVVQLERRGINAFLTYSNKMRHIPCNGEVLLIVENNRLMIWVEGGLYFDESGLNRSLFDIEMYGQVKVSDLIIFVEPHVRVSYFNALNEKMQEINIETANNVILTEYLFDDLGRQCITTKPMRLGRSANQPLVAYYSNFVTNKDSRSANSVWKIGRMQGEIQSFDPYNFYQITYSDNPLNEKSRFGLPGQEFSVLGPFAKRFTSTTKKQFITRHYPPDQHYRYQVEHKFGGIEDIKVFDNKNNTVAWLTNVPGKSDLLATYEYNDDGKLVQSLSPLYHEKVGTFRKLDTQIRFFSNVTNEPNNSLYVKASYDRVGNTLAKTALDSGKVEYIYGDGDLLKFNIFYSSSNNSVIENVIYYNYDYLGRLINTGKLISPPAKENLLNLKLTKLNTEEYQVFYHSDFEKDPTLRGRLKRSVTYNDGIPFIEESIFNEDENNLSKRIIAINENSDSDEPLIIATNKVYKAGKLREIEYPINVDGEPFKITYSYDKLGRIKAIGVPKKSNFFVDFAYNSNGQIEFERHLPDRSSSDFTRKYSYNSASYLTQLEDKFLTENIYYTEGSYDARGYGDGTVSRTEFKASWHQYADSSKLGLNDKSFISEDMSPEESRLCFNKLKEEGYLSQLNRQTKTYYPSSELEFPIICSKGTTSRQVQNVLGKQGFPAKYGHLYDYGHYQELVKAKYFVGEDIPSPLQPDTFAHEIPNVNVEASREIWKILKSNGYITVDKYVTEDSYFKPHGKQGNSFIRSTLKEDLKNISDGNYQYYRLPLEKILAFYFSKRQDFSLIKLKLKNAFSKWLHTTNSHQFREIDTAANVIVEMLENQGYLQNPLDKKFYELFVKYQSSIPDIVKVLLKNFDNQLGESEFDVEAYDIDENGNHKHYYSGFDRYELKYHDNTNQIEAVNFKSFASSIPPQSFSMKHDSNGNVVQALHKGIKNITYHPVSNRATSIELVDGKKLIFYYDAQGERVLKRVLDITGAVKKEIHYVRDEFGRSLVERELIWNSPNLPPSILVTVYIYGPKGLIGFLRRDEYYSVITDHEGSVRLVIKDGEVVAAYDYLPYGNIMRKYGINSEAHISYRYTGQEWDEESDLYNYHARFYDPSIGRFYQHDPKMQYFSPYKYAGNSPVSMIDPNGEFAFLLFFAIVGFGLLGAYFSGAAYSHSFNLTKWKWNDIKLYGSLVFGFVGGALIPVMLPYSVAAFSALGLSFAGSVSATGFLGLVGVYAGMARAANEWDPSKWDLSRPELWNGAYIGFSTFAGAPGGIHTAAKFYMDLSTVYAKGLFLIGSGAAAGGLISLRLVGRKLDFSKPAVYVDIIESILFAADIPMALHGGGRFFKKNFGIIANGIKYNRLHRAGFVNLEQVQSWNSIIVKSSAKLLGGTAIVGASGIVVALVTTENGLDFSSASTYQAIMTGAMMARGFSSAARSAYKKREIKKNLEASENTRKTAEKTVGEYKKLFEDDDLRNNLFTKNTAKLQEKLDEGQIPNSVVSIVVTKNNKMFTAFSGEGGPGFLSTYDMKGKSQSHVISTDNSFIGYEGAINTPVSERVPWKVALNDDAIINSEIQQGLKDKRNHLREANYKTYLNEWHDIESYIGEQILPNIPPHLRTYLNHVEIERVVNKIGENIFEQGYFPKDLDALNNIFVQPLMTKYNLLKKTNDFSKTLDKLKEKKASAMQQLEEKIIKLEEGVGLDTRAIHENIPFAEKKALLSRRLEILNTMKTDILQHSISVSTILKNTPLISSSRNANRNILNSLWHDRLKKYSDKFAHWEPTNCAEPHAVALASRRAKVFTMPNRERYKSYNIDDINYIASYKITYNKGIIELEPIARCANCEVITERIRNVVTDPEWKTVLANEKTKLHQIKANEAHYYRTTNFFSPYYILQEQEKKKQNGKNAVIYRKKRAAVENNKRQDFDAHITEDNNNFILENYEESSSYKETKFIGESVNGTRIKPTNFTNNLFGWVKASVNKLFDSKKILSENASNSNLLKRIADSNNSLTAVTAFVDLNSTLLLLDTVIRKVTGQKYISSSDDNAALLESRGYSLDIGAAFEKTMKYAASNSGISMHRFNTHYMEIQDQIIDKIMSGKLDEIAEILIAHAEKACPKRETDYPGRLSRKKFEKFIDLFSKRIDIELNKIMQKNKRIQRI